MVSAVICYESVCSFKSEKTGGTAEILCLRPEFRDKGLFFYMEES